MICVFRLYKKYLKKNIHWVIIGPVFKLLEAIFELLVPLVIKNMIDIGINGDGGKSYLIKQGVLLLIFAATGLCSTLVCQFIASRVSQRFGTDVRNDYFKHINSLSFKELDYLSTSSIITRQTNDIFNVEKSVAMLIRLVIRSPFIVIGSTALAFVINPIMGIVFLITGILLFIIFFMIMKLTLPRNKKIQKSLDNVTTITTENFTGVRQVRAFRKEEYEVNRFNDETSKLASLQVGLGKISAFLNPLTFIVVNAAIILVMYIGMYQMKTINLSVGDIQALINYLNQILIAIIAVTNLVTIFTKAQASSVRINEVFDMKSSINDGSYEEGLDTDVAIEFKNVTFNYNIDSYPAVSNLNFKVYKGQTIGIIGGTGSGKSTIVNLINRFYDTTSGDVYLNGRNIKDYKLSYVNHNISTVLQKAVLFNGNVIDNLCYGKKNASIDEINHALKVAQADFISKMPDGLNARVLQGGKNLSGGQRQRLSIARAILKNSPVLVLDDSSSALDYQTDYKLRMAIKELKKTTFIISQRASSIAYADQIIVLDNGKIDAIGCHDELLEKSKLYREICISQEMSVKEVTINEE
ncbi:MAG TPA: ATP-binding protein [Acholeplasmatales bacterium]|nr:ATP-binding protein [Acholeplasmatales bacterium]